MYFFPFGDISALFLSFPKVQNFVMNLKQNCFDFRHFLFPFGRFFGVLVSNFLGFAGFPFCVGFFLLFRSKSLNILVLFVI